MSTWEAANLINLNNSVYTNRRAEASDVAELSITGAWREKKSAEHQRLVNNQPGAGSFLSSVLKIINGMF